MKLIVRLRPEHRGVYSLVVQEERLSCTSPVIEKLGTYSSVTGNSYLEVSFKHLSLWLDLGVPFTNKRLLSFLVGFHARS
jgi:ribosomal protein S16